MNRILLSILVVLFCVFTIEAQDIQALTTQERDMIDLSNKKWQWMSDKDTTSLKELFHDQAQFVHMGGYWGKKAELNTIGNGGIWYKKAEIHRQEVKFAGPVATVYSTIHLNSVVGGNEVRFPFFVTETYLMDDDKWMLTSLVFTRTLGD